MLMSLKVDVIRLVPEDHRKTRSAHGAIGCIVYKELPLSLDLAS